jgi:hypothetical protein
MWGGFVAYTVLHAAFVTIPPGALLGLVVLTIVGSAMFGCLPFAMASFALSDSTAQGVFIAPSILPDASGPGLDAGNMAVLIAWTIAAIVDVVVSSHAGAP